MVKQIWGFASRVCLIKPLHCWFVVIILNIIYISQVKSITVWRVTVFCNAVSLVFSMFHESCPVLCCAVRWYWSVQHWPGRCPPNFLHRQERVQGVTTHTLTLAALRAGWNTTYQLSRNILYSLQCVYVGYSSPIQVFI